MKFALTKYKYIDFHIKFFSNNVLRTIKQTLMLQLKNNFLSYVTQTTNLFQIPLSYV